MSTIGRLAAGTMFLCVLAQAEEVVLTTWETSGQLTFNELPHATAYRVEWAANANGAWTNFTGDTGHWLDAIPASGGGSVTAAVPMFYRVVATVTNPADTMVRIQGITFVMGATTNMGHEGYIGETPQHTVTLDPFELGATEVTQAAWDKVYVWATNNGYQFDNPGSGKSTNHPVQMVNWYDVVKWCNAKSEMESLTPCFTTEGATFRTGSDSNVVCNWAADGYRLPTDAEWECAGRGGVAGHRFPWTDSDEIQHARANYNSSTNYAYDTSPTHGYHPLYSGEYPYTAPVGSFSPNGYGLFDMAGNVYEWCWDFFLINYYSSSPAVNPRGPATGPGRVIRSGDYASYAYDSRVATRRYDTADTASAITGFRLARRALE